MTPEDRERLARIESTLEQILETLNTLVGLTALKD